MGKVGERNEGRVPSIDSRGIARPALSPVSQRGRLSSLLALLLLAAVALRLADAALSMAIGAPRGVVRHETVEAAEQALGVRIALPVAASRDLEATPAEILTTREPVATVSIAWRHRTTGEISCRLVQVLSSREAVPEWILPSGRLFDRRRIDFAGGSVVLRQLELDGRRPWDEIEWPLGARWFVLRWQGPPAEFVRMAESIPMAGP